MKLSLIIILIKTILSSEVTLPNREYLTFINKNTSSNFDFGIKGKIFSENENKDEDELNFKMDFQYNKSIMGQKEKVNWGINCEEKNFNDCYLKNNLPKTSNYLGSNFIYRESSFSFNFLNENPQEFKKFFDCELISEFKNDWVVDKNWGVLGMNPQSDFKNYITQNSEKNVSILFDLSTNKKNEQDEDIKKIQKENNIKNKIDSTYEEIDFEMKIFLNPLITSENNIYFQFMENKNSWDIKSSIKIKEENFNTDQEFCITSNNPQILYTENYLDLKAKILFEICGKKDKCPEKFSDITKAPNVIIFFDDNKKIIFSYEDFIFIQNEEIMLRIEDIKILHDKGECLNYKNAFGLLFFKNTKLILTYLKNGNTSLSLTDTYTFYQNNTYFVYYVIAFLILLVTGILVYFCYLDTKKEGLIREEEGLLMED